MTHCLRLYVFAIDTFKHSYFTDFPSRSSVPGAQLPWLHEWFLSFISHGNCKSQIGSVCFLSDKHDQGFIMTSNLRDVIVRVGGMNVQVGHLTYLCEGMWHVWLRIDVLSQHHQKSVTWSIMQFRGRVLAKQNHLEFIKHKTITWFSSTMFSGGWHRKCVATYASAVAAQELTNLWAH